jgi:hypothetical protein
MLHASFDIWYMSAEKKEAFKMFCVSCDKYQRLSQDDKNVCENGDTVFTREHYEMLGTFLHAIVVNYLQVLRRDCPEWAFIVGEFHNFVIEREMRRLQVGWVGRGVGEVQQLIMRMQDL